MPQAAAETPTPAAEDDGSYELAVCKWEGRIHCVYLNDYRIAGGKPWGGGNIQKTWRVTLKDIASAVPAVSALAAFAGYAAGAAEGQHADPLGTLRDIAEQARAVLALAKQEA